MADETEQKPVNSQAESTETSTAKKPAAKKSTPRKPAAKKTAATADDNAPAVEGAQKPAAKKAAAKKPAAKKPAAKKVTTDVDAPKAETAKKAAVKKPAAKKSAATTNDSTTSDKKPAAKKAAAPKAAAKKADPAPKAAAKKADPAPKPTATKKKAEPPAKAAVVAEAAPIATPKAPATGAPIKSYEAPEGRKSARGRIAKKVDDAPATTSAPKAATPKAAAPKAAVTEPAKATPSKPVAEVSEKTKPSARPDAKKSADKTPENPRTETKAPVVDASVEPAAKTASEPDKKKAVEKKESTPQELLDRGAEWLKELFVRMNLKAKVETQEQDTDLLFNVSVAQDSPASESLHARALESIQTLLADVLSERGIGRVVVDIDGFLQNRDTELASIASKLAKAARKVNGALTVAGFNSHERRVIHENLEGEKDLNTESTDVGSFRKLRISNKK